MVFTVMFEASKRVVDRIQIFSDKDQRRLGRHEELHMILKQVVNIVLTIKTPVHDQINPRITKNIQLFKQMADCLGIRNIACEFSIVKRQVGLLPKDENQIQLWELVVLLVAAILHLP